MEKNNQTHHDRSQVSYDIKIRLTTSEREYLEGKAREFGCSLSQIARKLLARNPGKSFHKRAQNEQHDIERKPYSMQLTMRLSASEYEHIEAISKQFGCSISRTVRTLLMWKDDSELKDSGDRDFRETVKMNLDSIRRSYKKHVKIYNEVVGEYKKRLADPALASNPVVAQNLLREIRIFSTSTLELQSQLTFLFKFFKESPAVNAAPHSGVGKSTEAEMEQFRREVANGSATAKTDAAKATENPAGMEVSATDNTLIKYRYMEKMTIVGTVLEEPTQTENRFISMSVSVARPETKNSPAATVKYTVTAGYDEALYGLLHKETRVAVVGDYSNALYEPQNGGKAYVVNMLKRASIAVL